MLMVNQLAGFGAGGATGPFSAAFQGVLTFDANNVTTVTLSTPLGAPSPNRKVVLLFPMNDWYGVGPTVTIGGVPATLAVDPDGAGHRCFAWYANVPDGTSANIVINFGDPCFATGRIGVWTLLNAVNPTPFSVGSFEGESTHAPSCQINVPAGGVVMAAIANGNFTDGSFTWLGAVELWDVGNIGDYSTYSGAWETGLAAQTGRFIVATYSTSGGTRLGSAMVALSWVCIGVE
jgi:hypothetical protein